MRRLLFVDDEVAILRALERLLRSHRRQWECQFSDDPAAALDLVDSFAPDAVISDMLMPGLDGAEFLAAASQRRPVMARFILSGEVGAGALVRMAMAAHQCLAKPCRGDVLTGVLQGALIEPARVRTPSLIEGLYALRGLPVAPAPFAALRRCLADGPGEARDAEAIRLIEGAPGIATKLLQVATWTRLGFGDPPATMADAFYQLGPDAVASLVNSDLLRPQACAQATPYQVELWRRCGLAGPVAAAIARAEGYRADEASRLTLVALWHAAAPLLLDAVCRSDYARVRQVAATSRVPLSDLEQEHFGLTAIECMAQLLRLWGLPPDLAAAVAQSGPAAALPPDALSPEGIAHVAVAIVDALDHGEVPAATLHYVHRLNLTSRLAAWRGLAADALERAA